MIPHQPGMGWIDHRFGDRLENVDDLEGGTGRLGDQPGAIGHASTHRTYIDTS
jgi:hypothetical protein